MNVRRTNAGDPPYQAVYEGVSFAAKHPGTPILASEKRPLRFVGCNLTNRVVPDHAEVIGGNHIQRDKDEANTPVIRYKTGILSNVDIELDPEFTIRRGNG